MNSAILKAILSMDAYNRGYGQDIILSGNQIGNATISEQSNTQETSDEVQASFYAIAYDYDGETIISYRGTDDFGSLASLWTDGDIWNGWTTGAGSTQSRQAEMAFLFYHSVIGGQENSYTADVSFAGHSLGGGLAGLVAGVYEQDATVFDHMPYQKTLINIEDETDSLSQNYNEDLKELIYGSDDPADYSVFSHHAFSIDGEVLADVRNGVVPTSTIDETVLTLGTDVDLSAVQRHSMSSLVLNLYFADQDFGQLEDWNAAAKYFWPVLYDDAFAQSLGLDADASVTGALQTGEKFSDILRVILAYSAIDEGARVFGDTGIRALYDDANDLGGALSVVGASGTIHDFAKDISKVFVQFAGELALHRVLQSDVPGALAVNGVLVHADEVNNHTLTVNLSDEYWYLPDHDIFVARGNLTAVILGAYGLSASVYAYDIDRVVFATRFDDTTLLTDNPDISPGKTLFVGSSGNDVITGSGESDILVGGSGHDTVNYAQEGGSGGIAVTTTSARTYSVTDTYGNTDTLAGIESIVFTDKNDTAYINLDNVRGALSLSGGGDDYDPNNGVYTGDKLDVAGWAEMYFKNGGIVYYNRAGTGTLSFDGFENVTPNAVAIPNAYYGVRPVGIVAIDSLSDIHDYSTFAIGNIYNTAVNFSGASGPATYFGGYAVQDANGEWQQLPETMTIGGQSIDVTNIDTIYGTQYGDYVEVSYWNKYSYDSIFTYYTGSGDDTIIMTEEAAHNAGAGMDIHYRGGNDYYQVTGGINKVFLDDGIMLEDVSYQVLGGSSYTTDVLLTIADHGSLRIKGSMPSMLNTPIEVVLESGGKIRLYPESWYGRDFTLNERVVFSGTSQQITTHYGTWGHDEWRAHIALNETFYGKGGDDTVSFTDSILNYTLALGNGTLSIADSQGNASTFTFVDIEHLAFGGVSYDYENFISSDGGSGNDVILQAGDNHTLRGGDGDDYLYASSGDNYLYGDAGNDVLKGGLGADNLSGGDDNDTIVGGSGNDAIAGGNGIDMVSYETAASGVTVNLYTSSALDGDGGTDSLSSIENAAGSYFDDTFFSNSVDNRFEGRGGSDTASYIHAAGAIVANLRIGAVTGHGTDTLVSIENITGSIYDDLLIGDSGNNILNGNSGINTVSYAYASGAVTASLLAGTATGDGNDTLMAIQNIVGSAFADIVIGNSTVNVIYGEAGSDNLRGYGGDDVIYGGADADWLYGMDGNDVVYGGNGDDRLYGDKVNSSDPWSGNDTLHGEDGNDSLYGHEGDDILNGGVGDDLFVGGAGNDAMEGGNGNDTVYYTAATGGMIIDPAAGMATGEGDDSLTGIENIEGSNYNDIINGDESNNIIRGYSGDDTIRTFGGADFIRGYEGNDYIEAGTGDDYIDSDQGNDVIYGGDGIDQIYGDIGDDIVYGGAGDDAIIRGDAGSDRLYGGTGADLLRGGSEADTFVWLAGDIDGSLDKIDDFSILGGDKIDISDVLSLYDPVNDLLSDYLQITEGETGTTFWVDPTGSATFSSAADFVVLAGVTNILAGGNGSVSAINDLQSLVSAGTVLV